MGVDSISTYAVFQSTLRDAGNTQAELLNLQGQLSSGLKSQNFQGLGDKSQQFLDLDDKITRADQYISNNNLVQTRINSTVTVLGQVIDTTTSLKNLISSRRSGALSSSAFSAQLDNLWQTLVGQLNTSAEGRYLFSGTKTDVPAVDADNFPTLESAGVPDLSYYQGSSNDVYVRAQDTVEFAYNVRADADAFQKIFAALATAKSADSSNNDAGFAEAYNLAGDGNEGIIAIQATVNSNKVTIDNINDNLNTLKLYWKGIKEDIANTDLVAVSTQVAINQGILQAAFQAFAKINSLRLSDFLR